jgi:protease-4
MDQTPRPTPPPPPPGSPAPVAAAPAPVAGVTSIRLQPAPAGLGRIIAGVITGVAAVAAVFVIGMGAGVVLIGVLGLALGGGTLDQAVLWSTYRRGGSSTVAIVPVKGVIDGRRAEFVRLAVRDVLANSSVKAVVLRVDSPGGGVTASDEIWFEVERLRGAGLPVIASYGSVAASGGYYVSCAADFIMAQETCVTGSIGVIAQILTFDGLMDKVGVEPVTLVARRSPRKSVANDVFRAWTEEDRTQVLGMLDTAYDIFNARVSAGRSTVITDPERLDAIANGSIFGAQAALDSGLIDGIGYLDDAIARAEQAAGLATGSATVRRLSERPSLFGMPLVRAGDDRNPLFDPERLRTFVNDLGRVRLMYLMPAR